MRNLKFAPNEYYHLCCRGTGGNNIFLDESDRARFLFLMFHFQAPVPFSNLWIFVNKFIKTGAFGVSKDKLDKVLKDRQIELISFCLMDNHFHLLVRNIENGAVSVYMQRVLMAYSKYHNAKYKKSGHLFQGPFTAVHIENNTQLLHASSYVHKNPKDIESWKESYFDYPYSSLKDLLGESRWSDLLSTKIILGQFKNPAGYRHFIETSTAKEYDSSLLQ